MHSIHTTSNMSKYVLVTGGCGYIGSITSLELIKSGYDVVILDDLSNSSKFQRISLESLALEYPGRKLEIIEEPVTADNVSRVLFSHTPVGIIHFAGFKSVPESIKNPMKYYVNNLGSFSTVLDSIIKSYYNGVILFSSSASIYGNATEMPLTEESPRLEPESPYANTKRICEDLLRDACRSYDWIRGVSLRYFNPIGAHESGLLGEQHSENNNLLTRISEFANGKREKFEVYGTDYDTSDGSCERDFIDVNDLAAAHVALLNSLLSRVEGFYDVFNVGTGTPVSVLEIIRTYEEVSGDKLDYKVVGRRSGDVVRSYCDPKKLMDLTGWKPTRSLDDSIRSAIQWTED